MANQPISHAATVDDNRDRAIEETTALAHVVKWAVGLRGTGGAFEVAAVARLSSLLGLTHEPANLGEVAGASDAVAIQVNNNTSGVVFGGEAILKGLELNEVQMEEVDWDLDL